MRNILVTGGTVFVSRAAAEYFAAKGENVFVLNRGSRPQISGVTPIICDRHALGDTLKKYSFDAVIDVSAYNCDDVQALHSALGDFKNYVFISSSAVYPETLRQPFNEFQKCGINTIWGDYGINKLTAEEYLLENVKNVYILRPPYLYGRGENLYRAPFIFDCAEKRAPVFVPREDLRLHFFNISDLCRFIDIVLEKNPEEHIFNVGNLNAVTAGEWIRLCFKAAGKIPEIITAPRECFARNYFCFYDYDYALDVSRMSRLMPDVKPIFDGICEEYEWYNGNPSEVSKKDYFEYINKNLRGG